jgi:hypothetical protein
MLGVCASRHSPGSVRGVGERLRVLFHFALVDLAALAGAEELDRHDVLWRLGSG